jgi:hypothetical protein
MRWPMCIPAKSNAMSTATAGTHGRLGLLRGFEAAPPGAAEMGEDMRKRRLAEYLPVENPADDSSGGSE